MQQFHSPSSLHDEHTLRQTCHALWHHQQCHVTRWLCVGLDALAAAAPTAAEEATAGSGPGETYARVYVCTRTLYIEISMQLIFLLSVDID